MSGSVTVTRLGHALAALREIFNDGMPGDDDPQVIARKALDADKAIRESGPAPQPQTALAPAIAQLADEMFAEAMAIAPASSEPDSMPDMADEIRAELLCAYSGRIRALLEPQS